MKETDHKKSEAPTRFLASHTCIRIPLRSKYHTQLLIAKINFGEILRSHSCFFFTVLKNTRVCHCAGGRFFLSFEYFFLYATHLIKPNVAFRTNHLLFRVDCYGGTWQSEPYIVVGIHGFCVPGEFWLQCAPVRDEMIYIILITGQRSTTHFFLFLLYFSFFLIRLYHLYGCRLEIRTKSTLRSEKKRRWTSWPSSPTRRA